MSECSSDHDSVLPLSGHTAIPATDKPLVTPMVPQLLAITISSNPPADHGFRAWQYDHQYDALQRELRLCTAEADALLADRPLSASNRSKDIVLRERIRELLHEQDVLNEVYER
jgi:hypothetical protein